MIRKNVYFEELGEFIRGVTFDGNEAETNIKHNYLPILRAGNIEDTLNTRSDLVWVPERRISKEQFLQKNDIVICMASGSKEILGKTAQADSFFNGSVGAFCGIIRIQKADPKYIAYWFKSQGFKRWRDQQARGVNIQNLRPTEVMSISIPIPPLDEQRRIAAILQKADRVRRLRRYARALSDGYLQSVFLEMFGDPETNPMGWEKYTFGELVTKFFYGTSEKCYDTAQGLPVLRIPNVINGEVDTSDIEFASLSDREAKKLELISGDILFVRTNGNPDYVGRCAVFNLHERYLFASYLICGRLDLNLLEPEFVANYLRSRACRESMKPYIRTTAGQSNIGIEGLSQIPIIVPPRQLQTRFVEINQRHQKLARCQKESARQAEQLFQSLLRQAFEG